MESTNLKPKELSKDLIHNLRKKNDGNIKMNGILQVVDMKPDGSFMTLSDGHSFSDVALFKTIRPKIQELEVKRYDVLSVTLLLHKGTINVLVSFEKVYSNFIAPIGKPVDFQSYTENSYANPQGDHKIPKTNEPEREARPSTSTATRNISGDDEEYTPISLLVPSNTAWMIKARVSKKGMKREFNSQKGSKGSVFNCVLIDNSGEIQGTFFTEAVERFYDYIIENNVYVFTNGEIRKAGRFNDTSNPIELHFNAKSEIVHCEDDGKIDNIKFNFVKIVDIPKKDLRSNCDVIGIISEVGEPLEITLKKGDTKKKYPVKIKDDSQYEIEVNVWGEPTGIEYLKTGATLILSDLTIGEYRGRVLNTKTTSKILNHFPDLPRVRELITWRNQLGKSQGVTESIKNLQPELKAKSSALVTVSHYRKIGDDVLLSDTEKKEFYNINAVVSGFGQSFYYDKCPNENCFRKVTPDESSPNSVECGACGVISRPSVPRFIGHVKVTDHTGSIYLNFSTDQVATLVFGKSCQELKDMQAISKDDFQSYLKTRCNIYYTFKVYSKKEMYNSELKVKHNLAAVYDQSTAKLKQANASLLCTLQKYKHMLAKSK